MIASLDVAGVDIVVVGAGAAGLAAARTVRVYGRSVLVLEARGRIGGRAWTVTAEGVPVDLGCGWLHSAERNPWTATARALGLDIDKRAPDWGWGDADRRLGTQAAARRAGFARAWAAIQEAGQEVGQEAGQEADPGKDAAVAALLPAGESWTDAFAAVLGFITGADAEKVSAADVAAYGGSDRNWRVAAGYGTLVGRYGAGLPVRCGTPVTAVDWSGPGVRLDTPAGTVRARVAVLTMPPALLAAGVPRFTPDLPDETRAAAEALPMGAVAKLFLALEGDGPEIDRQVIGTPDRRRTGIYHLRPLGRPVIECYYGGALAAELEAGGIAALTGFAVDELAGLFGGAIRSRLRPAAASSWTLDPWARGAYAYAVPGAAAARDVLRRPIGDRLFLAGEACTAADAGTAHGAYLTGVAAARAALRRVA